MPNRPFLLPNSIEPLHVALALCDWIGHRTAPLEAPEVLSDAGWKRTQEKLLPHDSRTTNLPTRAAASTLFAMLAITAVAGCSQSQLPVYPVSGHLSWEGDWATGAEVRLHPLSANSQVRPHAVVDSHGNFRVGTYGKADGAPTGKYVVTLTWKPRVIDGEDYLPGPNVLPEAYADAATSPLVLEVHEGENQLQPFVLSRCGQLPQAGQVISPARDARTDVTNHVTNSGMGREPVLIPQTQGEL